MYANVLKFHLFIPHEKQVTRIFLIRVISQDSSYFLNNKIILKSRQQNISESIWARALIFGVLIGTEERSTN